MQNIVAYDMGQMGALIKRLKLNSLAGDYVKAQFPYSNLGQSGILIIGHMDTVYPIEHLNIYLLSVKPISAMDQRFAT